MAFSRITYTYSGQTTFAINFALGYLDRSHVTCRVNEEVDGGGSPIYRTITWVTDGTVTYSGDKTIGDTIVFERSTPKTVLENDYQDGDILDDDNLNESFKQAVMIAHEALDGRLAPFEQELDMNGLPIKNLKDPVNAQDAATKNYIDTFEAINTAAVLAARNTAELWANEDEDVVVADGEYSAKHYARKAETFAAGLALDNYDDIRLWTVNDDSAAGYSRGSRWYRSGNFYICTDATIGAAVWEQMDVTSADLGALATLSSVNNSNWSGDDLEIVNGGTGASSAAAARTNLQVYSRSEVYTKAEVDAAVSAAGVGAIVARGQFDSRTSSTSYSNNLSFSRSSAGSVVVTFGTARADVNYDVLANVIADSSANNLGIEKITKTTTNFTIEIRDNFTNAYTDAQFNIVVVDD